MSQSDNPVALRIYLVIHPILYALLLGLIGAVTCFLTSLMPTFLYPYLGPQFINGGWGLLAMMGLVGGALFGLALGLSIGLTASILSWANAGWKRLLAWTTLIGIGITVAAAVVGSLLFIISST